VVHMLSENATVTESLDDEKTVQFTRMPVYGASIDDIIGLVNKRDLFQAERKGNGTSIVGSEVKPITRVSEKLPVQKLLDMFIKNREHLFLVEDEFGQTAGVVTLEDAIETLLGREIVDETDAVEDMQELARGNYRARLRNNKLQDDV
jgi:CBS domain containing-hemolysin-like protein